MSWLDLFEDPSVLPPALRRLRRPTTLWYASAGNDWRPLVFTSRAWQRELAVRSGSSALDLPVPDLFVHTCLGPTGTFFGPGDKLYEDGRSRIECVRATPVRLDRGLVPWVHDRGWAHFGDDPRLWGRPDGHLLEVAVRSHTGLGEVRCHVLYLEHENNHAWDVLFEEGRYFDLTYVCATREGLGMGGCGKSVLQHIYEEGRIDRARWFGVDPRFVITWCDCTDGLFRRAAGRLYPGLRRLAPYIGERELAIEHWLYETWTPPTAAVRPPARAIRDEAMRHAARPRNRTVDTCVDVT